MGITTKFSKADCERVEILRAQLREMADEIEGAMEALNEPITAINALITAYNEKIDEANGVIEDIANEVEEYVDDKSEKWQESERGEAVTEWLNELQTFALEEVEEIMVPELPTLDHDGQLENIPQEASL